MFHHSSKVRGRFFSPESRYNSGLDYITFVLGLLFSGPECPKIDDGWDFIPDPTEKAYSIPRPPSEI